jgi:molybdopterin synthase sulfur carrier subunit
MSRQGQGSLTLKIKVKGYLTFKKAIGGTVELELEVKNATVRGALETLSDRYGREFTDLIFDPNTKEVSTHIRVLVNGRHYNYLPKGLNTTLQEGDEIALFPPLAGG